MSQEGKTIKSYNDEEFCKEYSKLYEEVGYHFGDEIDEQKIKAKEEEFHKSKRYSIEPKLLEENGKSEKWVQLKDHLGYTKYEVSDFGRVKFDGKIIKQDDPTSKGYLRLDPDGEIRNLDHHVNVYTLIAMGFLGKKIGDPYDVHHIDNNGYNCRPEKLVLLTRKQHNAVHAKNKIEDIKSFLEEE